MTNRIVTFLTLCTMAYSGFAQPTDNPVASFYSGDTGYPAWTDEIAWDNVIDMSTYANGADDFEKFENARDELHAQGGGVLYYPGGTYTFELPDMGFGNGIGPKSRGLMLKKGVVIRGEQPTGDMWARPTEAYPEDGSLDLPTKFQFEYQIRRGGEVPREWNMIGLMPDTAAGEVFEDVDNVGLVWVNLDGAILYWGPIAEMAPTYGDADWIGGSASKHNWPGDPGTGDTWKERVPDGTFWADFVMGRITRDQLPPEGYDVRSGNGRLVMGNQFDNATVFNDVYYVSRLRTRHPGKDSFANFRFAARVTVDGGNAFVANNTLPFPTKNFTYDQASDKDVSRSTRDIAAGNLTAAGGVATLIWPGHGIANYEVIEMRRINEAEYLGFKIVTVVDSDTLAFDIDPAAPAVATADGSSMQYRYSNDKGTTKRVLFDYANSNGIDINKSVVGAAGTDFDAVGNFHVTTPGKGFAKPGVIMRDNFVFSRGMKGLEMAGMWSTAQNNRNQRYYLGKNFPAGYVPGEPALTGLEGVGFENWRWQTSESSSDYLSRGFDIGGRNVWIDSTVVENTGSIGNDGEGILVQRHTGIEVYSFAFTNNEQKQISYGSGTTGETGYIGPWNNYVYGFLSLGNAGPGFTGHETAKGPRNVFIDGAVVNNDMGASDPYRIEDGRDALDRGEQIMSAQYLVDYEAVYKGILLGNVNGTDTPGYTVNDVVQPPANVVATPVPENYLVEITYDDVATNEVGYRVERSINGGEWTTIAYRPMQEKFNTITEIPTLFSGTSPQEFRNTDYQSATPISELNPAKWVDYSAPPGVPLSYRVVALNAQDDDSGASVATSSLVLSLPGPSVPNIGVDSFVIDGDTVSITIVDGGLSYSVRSSDSLSGDPTSWPALNSGVTVGTPVGGNITVDIDISAMGDREFFVIVGD